MNDEFDWYVAQTSEEFHTLEHPKMRNVYDALTPVADLPPARVTSETFPDLVGRWEPGQVGGMQ